MRLSEIAPTKPKTAAQMRLDALKKQADQAMLTAQSEQQRQRLKKAQSRLAKLTTAPNR